jgi:hypothetical protein
MNDAPTSRDTRQQLRDALIDAITFRIELDVRDEIPTDFSQETRRAIVEEVLPNSRFILDSLTTLELQDEVALHRHIQGVLASTVYLVNRIREQRSRS